MLPLASGTEKVLHTYAANLQQSILKLTEELQSLKLKNSQLEEQINRVRRTKRESN